jgi:hypothetical protein
MSALEDAWRLSTDIERRIDQSDLPLEVRDILADILRYADEIASARCDELEDEIAALVVRKIKRAL